MRAINLTHAHRVLMQAASWQNCGGDLPATESLVVESGAQQFDQEAGATPIPIQCGIEDCQIYPANFVGFHGAPDRLDSLANRKPVGQPVINRRHIAIIKHVDVDMKPEVTIIGAQMF